jgi:hypothetical protein
MGENYIEIKKMEAEETDNVKNCCPSPKHIIISKCMFYIQALFIPPLPEAVQSTRRRTVSSFMKTIVLVNCHF